MGTADDIHVTDEERAAVIRELIEAGHGNRILLSCNATGVSKGEPGGDTGEPGGDTGRPGGDTGRPGRDLPFSYVLSTFVPLLAAQGLGDEDIQRILTGNPRDLLAVR